MASSYRRNWDSRRLHQFATYDFNKIGAKEAPIFVSPDCPQDNLLPADGWLFGSITYSLDFWRGSQVTIFKSITKML
jgi:hypothetical protein